MNKLYIRIAHPKCEDGMRPFWPLFLLEHHEVWGWHVRFWWSNDIHAGYSQAFGWHMKIKHYVRSRSRA